VLVKFYIVLVVFGVMVLGSGIARADRIQVAVVPVFSVNVDTARVDAIGQDLAEALSTALEVEARGGLDVRRQLPPEGLPPDCVTTPACVADVAKRTGAQQLLLVFMAATADGVQVDTTWSEPATGRQAARSAIDLTSTTDAEAKAKFISVASKLLPEAQIRVAPTSIANVRRVISGQPRHLTTASIATGSVAVVSLGLGIGFGLATRSKYDACNAAPSCSQSQRSTISTDGHVADASFVIATGTAIATAILFATSNVEPRVIIAPNAQGIAAMYSGSF
jgi:hypothetical protein